MGTDGRNRDEEFQRLFQRFYRPVARFFVNRGFDPEESKDLTQETFVSVFRGIDEFRGEASDQTWLFKIAKNTWLNAQRTQGTVKRNREVASLDVLLETGWEPTNGVDETVGGPLDDTLEEERNRVLREAIDELPAQMRHCVFLRVAHDMKYREIAAVMQISLETVKSQLFQARDRLKSRLSDYFEIPD